MGFHTCCIWLLCLPASHPVLAETAVKYVQLPGGGRMPMSGLGLCCRETAHSPAVAQEVTEFLKLGGRHLDSAVSYGNTKFVGEAIRDAVSKGVPREEIFFATKVAAEMYGTETTKLVMDYVLSESGLKYVDLVLLHHPATFTGEELTRCHTHRECRKQSWQALELLQRQGKVRHIGVSNFGIRLLEELLEYATSPIAVNQIEYHPWVPATHNAVVRWCHERGVPVVAYASLGSPGTTYTKKTAPDLRTTRERLAGISARLGRPWQQVLLRWAVQHNVTVIPGTGNPAHMKLNMDLFDWSLSSDDMAVMDSVPEAERGLTFAHFVLDAAPEGISIEGMKIPGQGENGQVPLATVVIAAAALCCWLARSKHAKST